MSFHSGFADFDELIEDYVKKVDGDAVTEILKVGADALVDDVHALPSPRSARGHPTHMLDEISSRVMGEKVEVGWGSYYGLFLENGTRKMSARPHLKPTWETNKERYQELMISKIHE